MSRFDPKITALMAEYLAKGMAGNDYPDVLHAWNQAWTQLRVRGHTRGVDVEALSGVEMALYDCFGKLQRKPVRSLFAESPVEEVSVFAGSFFRSRGSLREQVERARAGGLRGAKVKVGFGVDDDIRVLSEIRKAWPDGMLVADANGAYDAETAARACHAFEGLELSWFEEPVLSDDWEGYERLKGSKVRIGAGESWFAGDFRRPIEEKLVGVLEPSVSRCGGIGVEMEVAGRAAKNGIAFSPMTGMNSALSLAASLQVAAAHPAVGVEFNPFPNPLQSDLAQGIPEPKNGSVRLPKGDGLGVSVDKGFVKKHTE